MGSQCCRDRADIRATRDNRHQHDDAGLTDPRPDIGRAAVVETANKAVVETANKAPVKDVANFRKHAPWTLQCFQERSRRSEEHTSELQSLLRTSYAVFCLTQK